MEKKPSREPFYLPFRAPIDHLRIIDHSEQHLHDVSYDRSTICRAKSAVSSKSVYPKCDQVIGATGQALARHPSSGGLNYYMTLFRGRLLIVAKWDRKSG